MNIIDYRKKTKPELIKAIAEKKLEMSKLVENIYKQSEKNVRKPGLLRKEIARMSTVLNEKEILGE